jgi:L-asparaginase / beta-aspartyl-peptidase
MALLKGASASAVDAVELAVKLLELNADFDAGVGAELNEDGNVELDAAMMLYDPDKSLGKRERWQAGAVAALANEKHAVSVARAVMERSEHVLIVGDGANRFAAAAGNGLGESEQRDMVVERAKRDLDAYRSRYAGSVADFFNGCARPCDTVGAVAIDAQGRLAAATSTGGICAQAVGRVGDTPQIGAGLYASPHAAVSATGHGESIAMVSPAKHVSDQLASGNGDSSVSAACQHALRTMHELTDGRGGLIAISAQRQWGVHFTAPRMPFAVVSSVHGVLHSGIEKCDLIKQ